MDSNSNVQRTEIKKLVQNCASMSTALSAVNESKSTQDLNQLLKFYLNVDNASNLFKVAEDMQVSLKSLLNMVEVKVESGETSVQRDESYTKNGLNTTFDFRQRPPLNSTLNRIYEKYVERVECVDASTSMELQSKCEDTAVHTSNGSIQRRVCNIKSRPDVSLPKTNSNSNSKSVDEWNRMKSNSQSIKQINLSSCEVRIVRLTADLIHKYTTKRNAVDIQSKTIDVFKNKAIKTEKFDNVDECEEMLADQSFQKRYLGNTTHCAQCELIDLMLTDDEEENNNDISEEIPSPHQQTADSEAQSLSLLNNVVTVSPTDENVYTVERLVKKRIRCSKVQYLVKWKGYRNYHNSWEPEENILDKNLVLKFEESKKGIKKQRRKTRKTKILEKIFAEKNTQTVMCSCCLKPMNK